MTLQESPNEAHKKSSDRVLIVQGRRVRRGGEGKIGGLSEKDEQDLDQGWR